MMGFWGGLCNGFAGYNPVGVAFGWLVTIALVGGLVLLAIWLVRRIGGHAPAGAPGNPSSFGGSAMEALQLRYARGEITREQYLQMRDDLA
ncbi:MAG: SHOCT domain-containing protein [Anaerolineae bacterium]